MEKWAENIKMVQDERIKLAIVTANNHYAGFGPGTANVFRNMLGLPVAKWEDTVKDQEHEIRDIASSTAGTPYFWTSKLQCTLLVYPSTVNVFRNIFE